MKDFVCEIVFLEKVLERLSGYSCGSHLQLEKMVRNRIKKLEGGKE